jgi:hypothetical protein
MEVVGYKYVLSNIDLSHNSCNFFCCRIFKHESEAIGGDKYIVECTTGELRKLEIRKTEKNDLKSAVEIFEDYFSNKTGNKWGSFKHQKKKHFMHVIGQEIDYSNLLVKQEVRQEIKSRLNWKLQGFIKSIINPYPVTPKKKKEEKITKLGITPFGMISNEQLKSGMEYLLEFKSVLELDKKNTGKILKEMSHHFFTLIPIESPFVINTIEQIQQIIIAIETMMNTNLLNEMQKKNTAMHPTDAVYSDLGVKLEIISEDTYEYIVINKYLESSNKFLQDIFEKKIDFNLVGYWNHYTYKLLQVAKIDTPKIESKTKNMLLIHGTPNRNIISILKNGLKINPGGNVYITGRLFGDGLYFADTFIKSCKYTDGWYNNWYRDDDDDHICLFLVEVAVDNLARYTKCPFDAGSRFKVPTGHKSVMGVGKITPDMKQVKKMGNCIVPVGAMIPSSTPDAYLNYNEYVVYNESDVRLRYIVTLKRVARLEIR